MRRKEPSKELMINRGNLCSRIAYKWAEATFGNRAGKIGAVLSESGRTFSGLIEVGDEKLAITSDGVGTKVELAERLGRYSTLGFDLIAMVVDDLAAVGAEPLTVSNILDADVLDEKIVEELMSGLHAAATRAEVTISGGEIARLGKRVSGYGDGMHFNWAATAVGLIRAPDEPLDGRSLEDKQAVIALRSAGLRSNGFTLAKEILSERLGQHWHRSAQTEQQSWGEALLTPSLIYAPLVSTLRREGLPLTGAVHVTGGGIPDNLRRVLRGKRLGACLDGLFPPHDFMEQLMLWGDVPPQLAYRHWNMGNGMLLIVEEEAVDDALSIAWQQGYEARRAGQLTADGQLRLLMAGRQTRLWLAYDVAEEGK